MFAISLHARPWFLSFFFAFQIPVVVSRFYISSVFAQCLPVPRSDHRQKKTGILRSEVKWFSFTCGKICVRNRGKYLPDRKSRGRLELLLKVGVQWRGIRQCRRGQFRLSPGDRQERKPEGILCWLFCVLTMGQWEKKLKCLPQLAFGFRNHFSVSDRGFGLIVRMSGQNGPGRICDCGQSEPLSDDGFSRQKKFISLICCDVIILLFVIGIIFLPAAVLFLFGCLPFFFLTRGRADSESLFSDPCSKRCTILASLTL